MVVRGVLEEDHRHVGGVLEEKNRHAGVAQWGPEVQETDHAHIPDAMTSIRILEAMD